MNAGLPAPVQSPPEAEVLGELLHTLSQPLTSLRCSLELSIDGDADDPRENVFAALEQTERVIGVVRLMQEYLDCEPDSEAPPLTPFAPALHRVLEQLSTLAEARALRMHFRGTCGAAIPVTETKLLLALRYLISSIIESQPAKSAIRFSLMDRSSESILTVHVLASAQRAADGRAPEKSDPVGATMLRARVAIACRVLEAGGATLCFGGVDGAIFQLRIPYP